MGFLPFPELPGRRARQRPVATSNLDELEEPWPRNCQPQRQVRVCPTETAPARTGATVGPAWSLCSACIFISSKSSSLRGTAASGRVGSSLGLGSLPKMPAGLQGGQRCPIDLTEPPLPGPGCCQHPAPPQPLPNIATPQPPGCGPSSPAIPSAFCSPHPPARAGPQLPPHSPHLVTLGLRSLGLWSQFLPL